MVDRSVAAGDPGVISSNPLVILHFVGIRPG